MNDTLNTYTSLDEAKTEIWKRWNNQGLKKEVSDYLGGTPVFFRNEPRAVLHRHVISPNYEYDRFLDLAMQVNLKPIGIEYTRDIFLTRNYDKLGLGKLGFFHGKNSKGESVVRYKKVIDLMNSEKKRFGDIQTVWGENLVDFHHRLARSHSEGIEVTDLSQWYISQGSSLLERYEKLLSFFVSYGVLFENFIFKEGHYEDSFTKEIFYPAFMKNTQRFGVSPIIVSLLPISSEDEAYWTWYPDELESSIEKSAIATHN